jgi:hypothetical protein
MLAPRSILDQEASSCDRNGYNRSREHPPGQNGQQPWKRIIHTEGSGKFAL